MTKIHVTVPLHEIAHSRTGDKGNRLNASLIAYDPMAYQYIATQVTAERVSELFSIRGPVRVRRYDLPKLSAFNFVIDDVLEGGVNGSLNLDGHGKTLSFLLLTMSVEVPSSIVCRKDGDPEVELSAKETPRTIGRRISDRNR